MDSHTNNPSTSLTDNVEARSRFLESMGLGTETGVEFPAAEVPAEMIQADSDYNPMSNPSTETSDATPQDIASASIPGSNVEEDLVLSSQPDDVTLPGASLKTRSSARVVGVQVGGNPAADRMNQATTSIPGAESTPEDSAAPAVQDAPPELPTVASLEEVPPPLENVSEIEDVPLFPEISALEESSDPVSDPQIEDGIEEIMDAAPAVEEPEALPHKTEAAKDSDEPLQLHCPKCKEELILRREHIGVEGACVWCGTKIVAAESGTDREVRVFAVFQPDTEKEENEVPASEDVAIDSLPTSPPAPQVDASDSAASGSEEEPELHLPPSEEIHAFAKEEIAEVSVSATAGAPVETPDPEFPLEAAPEEFIYENNPEEEATVPFSGIEAPPEIPASDFMENGSFFEPQNSEDISEQDQLPSQAFPVEIPADIDAGTPEATAPAEAMEPAAQLADSIVGNIADTQFSGSPDWPATPQPTSDEAVAAGPGEGPVEEAHEEPAPAQNLQHSAEVARAAEAIPQGSADSVAQSFTSMTPASDQPAPPMEQPAEYASPIFETPLNPMAEAGPASTEGPFPEEIFSPQESITTEFAEHAAPEETSPLPRNESPGFAEDATIPNDSPAPLDEPAASPAELDATPEVAGEFPVSTDALFGSVPDTTTNAPPSPPFSSGDQSAITDTPIPEMTPVTEAASPMQEQPSPMELTAAEEAPQAATPSLPEESPTEMKAAGDPFSSADIGFAITNESDNDAFFFNNSIPEEGAPTETPVPSQEAGSETGAPPELPAPESSTETETETEVPAPALEHEPILTHPAEGEIQPSFNQAIPVPAGSGLFAQAATSGQTANDAESENAEGSSSEVPAAPKSESKISLKPSPISRKRPRKGLIAMVVVLMGFVCGAAAASFLLPVEEYVQKAREFVEETLDPTSVSSSSDLPVNAVAPPGLEAGTAPAAPPIAPAPQAAPTAPPIAPAAPSTAQAPSTTPTPPTAQAPPPVPASPKS